MKEADMLMLILMGVIATVSASSLRVRRVMKIILLTSVGVIAALLGGVNK